MEKLELQILSGLHSGARHLIAKKRFTIGGDDDADLRLLDEEFDGVRISLETLESGALAVSADADFTVFDEAGRPARDKEVLAVGGLLKLGELWIALCPAGGLLAKLPSINLDARDQDFDSPDLEGFSFEDLSQDDPAAAGYVPHDHDIERSSRRLRRKAAAGFVGGVIAILVVGLGVAWMPSEAHTSLPVAVAQSNPVTKPEVVAAGFSTVGAVSSSIDPRSLQVGAVSGSAMASPAPVSLAAVSAVSATNAPKVESGADGEARQWLEESLSDKGLATLLTTRVAQGEISIAGKLDRSELRDFEKLLPEVEARLGGRYRIKAQIEPSSVGPTFRIREVVLGKDGWIVTDMGQRVLLGGTIDGYRLMAIEGNKVIFMGATRVEIQI